MQIWSKTKNEKMDFDSRYIRWRAAGSSVMVECGYNGSGSQVSLRPLERCRIGHNWIMTQDTTDQDACALNWVCFHRQVTSPLPAAATAVKERKKVWYLFLLSDCRGYTEEKKDLKGKKAQLFIDFIIGLMPEK